MGLKAQQAYPSHADVRADVNPLMAPFYHGVASGDPLADRVIIWTRVSDQTGNVSVTWKMATDTLLTQVVNSGSASTDSSVDFCIKVDVTGLQPNSWYYYQFDFNGQKSLIGRTRTLPVGDVDSLRIVLMSCQDYEAGYYNIHESLVNRNDIDAIVFVGDYIYEYAGTPSNDRFGAPDYEILSLDDYRTRHSTYKLDAQLRKMHQQYPWFAVWDDHEIANNGWVGGAENHLEGAEGNWFDRRTGALRTYFDWMPVRKPDPQGEPERIYRKFKWGNLADILMLDTRYEGRDIQPENTSDPIYNDTTHTILGTAQRNWLFSNLDTTQAQWKIFGQQVMMAPLQIFGFYPNLDQWDGYPTDRNRLFNKIINDNIDNVVVLTGDIHTGWANDLPLTAQGYNANTGAGSVGVEFVCTSVTSLNANNSVLNNFGAPLIQSSNPHMKYIDLAGHGAVLVDINKTRTQGEFWNVNTISNVDLSTTLMESWYVNDGERFLRQGTGASVRVTPNPALAPYPYDTTTTAIKEDALDAVIFGLYPNPVVTQMVVQYYLHKNEPVTIQLIDMQGKTAFTKSLGKRDKGLNFAEIDLTSLKPGTYVLALQTANKTYKRFIVKI